MQSYKVACLLALLMIVLDIVTYLLHTVSKVFESRLEENKKTVES